MAFPAAETKRSFFCPKSKILQAYLYQKEIHAHDQSRKTSRTFSEPKKRGTRRKNILHTHISTMTLEKEKIHCFNIALNVPVKQLFSLYNF